MNIFNLICHRKPERSFFIKGHQFPVCARCTGFYISVIIYFICSYYFFVDYNVYSIVLAIILLIPSAIDGLTQYFKFRVSNNALRLITGLLGGLGLSILIKTLEHGI